MNERIEEIMSLPAKYKLAIVVGVFVLVVGVFWFFFLLPVQDELSSIENEIEGPSGLEFQIRQQEGIVENLDQYLEEVARLEVELKKALQELPDKKEIDDLLLKISGIGKDSGLDIRLFRPREEQKKDYYAEVPVEMEVYGTFHQVATFFDEVGQLSRIVNLDEFSMKDPSMVKDGALVKTHVVATTFRFLDESERPKLEEKKDKQRRGRRGRRGKKES